MAEGKKTVDVIIKMANLQLKGKRRYQLYHQKSSLPIWSQVKALCIKEEIVLENAQSPVPPENTFLAMLSALTCVSLVSASGLMYCSIVSHPLPLLQLVDWMDPAPVIFTDDSVLMTRPWDHNRLIHFIWRRDCI